MREHNRVAGQLARINPTWSDERLFNEARRIVIATYQHIVYNEYVPIAIGWNTASQFDLLPIQTDDYYMGYDPKVRNSF